jgi:hypothetical protein
MNISKNLLLYPALALKFNYNATDLIKVRKFKETFHNWIHSSNQPVLGLPSNKYLVSGLTDAFNQTYSLYNKIGVFDGEYGYHHLVWGDSRVTTNLDEADVIIVSHPFSADGMCSHERLRIADTYNKPIFVDCAFFGSCIDINFDFTSYKNIHSVGFSLSKTLGTGWRRVGLLYTIDKYPVSVYEQWDYPLLTEAEYHYNLINTITPDTLAEQYRNKQLEICKELDLVPSNTIIFGLDYNNRYPQFLRGNVSRVCITLIMNSVTTDL